MQLVFQFPQTYFATKMNSETLEKLFPFVTISMATFFVSKSFHNLTSLQQPRHLSRLQQWSSVTLKCNRDTTKG